MATPDGALPAATVEKWTGLYKSVGRFAIPPGALQQAENVVLPGASLLTLRRGFDNGDVSIRTDCLSLGFYGSLVTYIDSLGLDPPGFVVVGADSGLGWGVSREKGDFSFAAATFNAVGFAVPASTGYRSFFTANGNLYIAGVATGLDVVPLPPTPTQNEGWAAAGMVAPVLTGGFSFVAGTFLPGLGTTVNGIAYPYGSAVAYRATFRYVDANGNIHRSPPSQKLVVTRTAGTATGVRVVVNPSPMVRPGTIVELWRTFTVPVPQDGSDATGDECFQIAEIAITGNTASTGPNAGYLVATGSGTPFASYDDNTPNTPYLVEPLYTNPTSGDPNGLGVGNANQMPPAAQVNFQFKGYFYSANTQEVQRLRVQIIGTGTGGIVDGDSFSVDGVNYMFKDTAPATAGYIFIQLWRTGGGSDKGSIVENLRATALAAADAINKGNGYYDQVFNTIPPNNPLNQKIYAYSTNVNGLPGYIAMERLLPDGVAFTVSPGIGAGRGWAGLLAVANTSDPNRQPNGLMQSQYNDPESVPPAFTELVGHADSSIIAATPLRDTCLLYKTAPDGLWKFTDDGSGNLQIQSLDATVNLIAPRTAVFLDNASYSLCDKGVLKVTDGGSPENISDEKLRQELADLVAHVGLDTIASVAFAVAYEAEKLYILNLPEASNATSCTIQYIYNLTTDAWTVWTIPGTQSGGVNPYNGKLYLGRDGSHMGGHNLWRERKDNTDDDYQDPAITTFTWPSTGTSDTFVFTGDRRALPYNGFAQGDRVVYVTGGHSYLAFVNEVTYDGTADQTTVVLSASVPAVTSESFTLRKAIQCPFTLLPLVDGDPLFDKQWQDLYLYFRYCVNDRILISYGTNRQQVPHTYPLPGPVDTAWYDDDLGWGELPWGGAAQDVILKLGLDQAASRSAELTLTIDMSRAGAGWQLSALRVPYVPTTQKVVR